MKKFKHVYISTLVPLGIMGLIYLIAYLTCGTGLVTNDCYEQYVPFFNAFLGGVLILSGVTAESYYASV